MVFNDIHTYLIISFLLMLVLLHKMAYKKFQSYLESKINNVSKTISDAENTKINSDRELLEKISEKETASENIEKITEKSREECESIAHILNSKLENLVEYKNNEYKQIIKKLQNSANSEIHSMLVNIAVEKTIKKITEDSNSQVYHNNAIENSLKMLSESSVNKNHFDGLR